MDIPLSEILNTLLAPVRLVLFAVLWPFYLVFAAIMLWGGATTGGDTSA